MDVMRINQRNDEHVTTVAAAAIATVVISSPNGDG